MDGNTNDEYTKLTENNLVSTGMSEPHDPESRAHARETSPWGKFEVVLVHETHGILGTLDETFDTEADAAWAIPDGRITEAGIETVVRPVER